MLYDPKWDGISLKSLIGWLETMPEEGTYNFNDCNGCCLIGQYMHAMGIAWEGAPARATGDWTDSSYAKVGWKLFGYMNPLRVAADKPHTFGAALERACKWRRGNE